MTSPTDPPTVQLLYGPRRSPATILLALVLSAGLAAFFAVCALDGSVLDRTGAAPVGRGVDLIPLPAVRAIAGALALLFLGWSWRALQAFRFASSGPGRRIVLTRDSITLPLSPWTRRTVTIALKDILRLTPAGSRDAPAIEIRHRRGAIRIPLAMLADDTAAAALLDLIQKRRAALREPAAAGAHAAAQPPLAVEASTVPAGATGGPGAGHADVHGSSASDLATAALQRAVAHRRGEDPLAGAQVAGRLVFEQLIEHLHDGRGVHAESLLCALGALAGYACQASLRRQALDAGLAAEHHLLTATGADGRRFFFGDALNRLVAQSRYSVWSLAAAAALPRLAGPLPDIGPIFEHVAQTVGTDGFGHPRLPPDRQTSALPLDYLTALWPPVLSSLQRWCASPEEWPLAIGLAVQRGLDAAAPHLPADDALMIVMESAIPMSKVDLASAAT